MTTPEPDPIDEPADKPSEFEAQVAITATAFATHPEGAVVPEPEESP